MAVTFELQLIEAGMGCRYHGEVAVIDPGADLAEHVEALLAGLAGEQVAHILITHTHRDHSPAARALQAATGAPTYGFGPHAGGKRGDAGVEEGDDWDFFPDKTIGDGITRSHLELDPL